MASGKLLMNGLPHLEIMNWDVGPRYRPVSYLGHGSYGAVCKAINVSN